MLGSIRRRIDGIVGGLRSGWSSLGEMAQGALEAIGGQIGSIVHVLGALARSAMAGIQSGWSALSRLATQLTDGLKRQLQSAVGGVMGAARAMVNAVKRLDANGIRAAWGRLLGLFGGVQQRLQQAAQAVQNRIAALWAGLAERFNGVLRTLSNRASELFERLQSSARGIHERLTSAWNALSQRASQLSTVAGGLLERLRSIVDRLLSWGREIWSSIQQRWTVLRQRLDGWLRQLGQQMSRVWQGLRERATAFWERIRGLWRGVQRWVREQARRLVHGVRSIWNSLRGLSITALVEKISALARIYRLARQVFEDFRAFLTPIATAITNRVYAGMPAAALGFARQQMGRVLGAPATSGPVPSTEAGAASAGMVIQRHPAVPRGTATWEEIWAGFWGAITEVWRRLTWQSFLGMVLDMLIEQLFPPLAVYRQLKAFILEDMAALVDGLFMPRNIFTDPLGALHDIYTNLLHIVFDFVLSLARRIVNILMAFMLWITIILTVLGAVGGSVVVAIFGAILAGLASFGIGAGAGAAGGAAVGGAAGAGVGFGIALLIGEAIFFAYLIVHAATIAELLLDLSTARQSDEEKQRDYAQLAESAIAVGVGLVLLFLAWLAGVISKGVAALLQRLGIKPRVSLPASWSRFFRGARSVRKPRPGGPSAEETAARLAAEQRLAPQVGGALARNLVEVLGPEAAEQLVARLGASSVRRLGTELGPEAIAAIARSLNRDVVERLLAGGMRPSSIHAAVAAGQGNRLAALTAEQIARLAGLSENGFNRIIRLPEAQFQRFANLGEVQLRTFAEMDEAAFNRFAALDDPTFARFGTMARERLQAFARMSDDAFNRFTALSPTDFAKFERLGPDALGRFASLSDPAFARFSALDAAALQKFANVPGPALERFGSLDPARLAAFAQSEPATIAKFAALSDAAFNRFARIRLEVLHLNKLGGIELTALENLATVANDGHLTFLSRALDAGPLGNIGQLAGHEIDTLIARVGTNPARLTTLGALDGPTIRNFLGIGDDALLQRYASLTPTEISAFRGLSTAELERFAEVAAADLPKFGRLGSPAALRRFAALAPEEVAALGTLSEPQLGIWANVQPSTLSNLARLFSREAPTLGILTDRVGTSGLNRLGAMPGHFVRELSLLDGAAMQRYLRLPADQLAKFENMTAFNMQQMANRPPGELEALAATRTSAELMAEAGDTPAARAARRAEVLGLDDPTINPHTGRPRGHASEHSAAIAQSPAGGGMSAVERRLRTGQTPGGAAGPIPPDVSVFASDAAQMQAARLGEARLQAQIDAGNPLGPGPNGRHTFNIPLEGAGYSYRIQGGRVDPGTGNITGGVVVRRQVGSFTIVYEPTTATPTSLADYFIVTMFPE